MYIVICLLSQASYKVRDKDCRCTYCCHFCMVGGCQMDRFSWFL